LVLKGKSAERVLDSLANKLVGNNVLLSKLTKIKKLSKVYKRIMRLV